MDAEYSEFLIFNGSPDPDSVGEAARMIKGKLDELIKLDGKDPNDYYFKPTFYQDERKIVVEAFRK